MKQCESCRFGNPDETNFRRHCGKPFQNVQAAAPATDDSETAILSKEADRESNDGMTSVMPAAESADPDGRESAADAPVPDVPANGQTDDQTDATVPIETTSVNEETATRAMPQQAANVEDETRPIAQQSAQATQPVQPVPPTQPVPPAQQAPQTQSVPPVQPQYPQQSGFGGQGFQQTGRRTPRSRSNRPRPRWKAVPSSTGSRRR